MPITRPSRGVNPMDVSIDLPFLIAVMLAPFPRWQEIIFFADGYRAETSRDMYSCEIP